MKSPSTITAEFIKEIRDAAAGGSILKPDGYDLEVLDSKWQKIREDSGIVVSNSEWDFAPDSEQEKFYDALLILGFYCRVTTDESDKRADERDVCFELARIVVSEIRRDLENETSVFRDKGICDVLILRAVDGMDNSTSQPYAIINQPIILNPTGSRDFNLGEAK